MGDIHLRLYPEECPKTVENFTTHCRNGYYDNLIFHRVIKGFMVQTGDPLGDGTGGQSIWGREFEDEFHKRYFSQMTHFSCLHKMSLFFSISMYISRLDYGKFVTQGKQYIYGVKKIYIYGRLNTVLAYTLPCC